ncbi:MAG: hypothetical protein HY925_14335 [Elusimicrobia bacterium]|nr:hypothetical protein [Elusimicrobiota bacterium]
MLSRLGSLLACAALAGLFGPSFKAGDSVLVTNPKAVGKGTAIVVSVDASAEAVTVSYTQMGPKVGQWQTTWPFAQVSKKTDDAVKGIKAGDAVLVKGAGAFGGDYIGTVETLYESGDAIVDFGKIHWQLNSFTYNVRDMVKVR